MDFPGKKIRSSIIMMVILPLMCTSMPLLEHANDLTEPDWGKCEAQTFQAEFPVRCDGVSTYLPLCDPGHYSNWTCGTEMSPTSYCWPCPENFFLDKYNNCSSCRRCKDCPWGYKKACHAEGDAVCNESTTTEPAVADSNNESPKGTTTEPTVADSNNTVNPPVLSLTTLDPDTKPVTEAEADNSDDQKWNHHITGHIVSGVLIFCLFIIIVGFVKYCEKGKKIEDPEQNSSAPKTNPSNPEEMPPVHSNGMGSRAGSPELASRPGSQASQMMMQGLTLRPSPPHHQDGQLDGSTDADRRTAGTQQNSMQPTGTGSTHSPNTSDEDMKDEERVGLLARPSTDVAKNAEALTPDSGIAFEQTTLQPPAAHTRRSAEPARGNGILEDRENTKWGGVDRAGPPGNPVAHGAGVKGKGPMQEHAELGRGGGTAIVETPL